MFSDPIELVDNPKAQNPELKWENVERADVYGLELDSLNLVANKTIGEHFIIGIKIKNLLNDTYSELYTFKDRGYIYRQFNLGMLFELSLKYQIR